MLAYIKLEALSVHPESNVKAKKNTSAMRIREMD
jgi:hypothetical protein